MTKKQKNIIKKTNEGREAFRKAMVAGLVLTIPALLIADYMINNNIVSKWIALSAMMLPCAAGITIGAMRERHLNKKNAQNKPAPKPTV